MVVLGITLQNISRELKFLVCVTEPLDNDTSVMPATHTRWQHCQCYLTKWLLLNEAVIITHGRGCYSRKAMLLKKEMLFNGRHIC